MPNTCCVCENPFTEGKSFTLTPEEREAIGPDAPQEIHYCKHCLRVMEDKESGAQLLKGLYEMQLAARGVPNAKAISERFHAELLAKAKQGTLRKMH